ncbi:hypothetical protein [Rhodopirellula bahusiensis]|uniref:hypothetical protein n=1 Tax=Rhodopirellula bahusiensis TaxID=2014065 RepID=UPI00117AE145|nr:hypothetical protein [Rhodopirellula bahusiensis]
MNEPTVNIQSDGFQQDWPANSERVKDLMIVLFHEAEGRMPSRQELGFAEAMLREECRIGGRRLSQAEQTDRDSDPIIQALHEFTSTFGEYSGRTEDLLSKLRELHSNRSNGFGAQITYFVNVFGRRLRQLTPSLRGYGIEVSVTHREDGSYCITKKLATFQLEATDGSETLPSASNSRQGRDLPPTDGTDGNIRIEPTRTNECDSDDCSVKGGSE